MLYDSRKKGKGGEKESKKVFGNLADGLGYAVLTRDFSPLRSYRDEHGKSDVVR